MRWIVIFIFFLIANIQVAQACTCAGIRSWCETTSGNSIDIIIKGVPVSSNAQGVSVNIIETIKGSPVGKEIRVPYGQGNLCYGSLHPSQIGDTLIIALVAVDSSDIYFHPEFEIGDYTFFICGTYFLEVIDEKVSGNITGIHTVMEYDQFRSYIEDCPQIDLSYFKPFPNPARSAVFAYFDRSSIIDIKVFDASGKNIYHDPEPSSKLYFNWNLEDIRPGIYFIQFNTSYKIITEKLVVQ